MNVYRYRLTVTFSSTREWRIGVEATAIGEAVARDIARNSGDVQSVCLSYEKTGKVIWLRRGAEYQQ